MGLMGPLESLFAQLLHRQPIKLDGPPSAPPPSFDDPALTEALLRSHGSQGEVRQQLPRAYNGPIDWLFNKPPAEATPPFRDKSMEVGPAPPTDRGRISQLLKGRK